MPDPSPRRLVLDTQVALDLLHFADPQTAVLQRALQASRCVLVTDADCRAEWQRVLNYETLRLDAVARNALLARFDALIANRCLPLPHPAAEPPLPRCRDPDDQKFLQLACASGAFALLTRDAELLRLARHHAVRDRFQIVAPRDFAHSLAEWLAG